MGEIEVNIALYACLRSKHWFPFSVDSKRPICRIQVKQAGKRLPQYNSTEHKQSLRLRVNEPVHAVNFICRHNAWYLPMIGAQCKCGRLGKKDGCRYMREEHSRFRRNDLYVDR